VSQCHSQVIGRREIKITLLNLKEEWREGEKEGRERAAERGGEMRRGERDKVTERWMGKVK